VLRGLLRDLLLLAPLPSVVWLACCCGFGAGGTIGKHSLRGRVFIRHFHAFLF
jgi:hypothetical protein